MEEEKRAEEIGEKEMLQLTFTEAEIKELDPQRYNYPHPRVQRKQEQRSVRGYCKFSVSAGYNYGNTSLRSVISI